MPCSIPEASLKGRSKELDRQERGGYGRKGRGLEVQRSRPKWVPESLPDLREGTRQMPVGQLEPRHGV